ncbi:hypothetical protein P7K49_040151, partial [Saguinus oedipus]
MATVDASEGHAGSALLCLYTLPGSAVPMWPWGGDHRNNVLSFIRCNCEIPPCPKEHQWGKGTQDRCGSASKLLQG